jgi:hypothetical protein
VFLTTIAWLKQLFHVSSSGSAQARSADLKKKTYLHEAESIVGSMSTKPF